jgi:hypothetical protein
MTHVCLPRLFRHPPRSRRAPQNLTEPCEEVRLGLARLLTALVQLAGGGPFAPYAGEAVDLLGSLAEDPFHEVQEEACALAVALNGAPLVEGLEGLSACREWRTRAGPRRSRVAARARDGARLRASRALLSHVGARHS